MRDRVTASLVLLGVCLSALVPRGFMPGDIARGQFLIVCPEGLEGFWQHHDHSHGHAHGHAEAMAPVQAGADNCDFADTLTPVLHLGSASSLEPVAQLSQGRYERNHANVRPSQPLWITRARAPPHIV
ncbi:MAG: hypothetical protein AAFR07_14550 [Pseudomonadota bacterium]